MAHFEEKILSYLDGSLPEADREEVLSRIASEHGAERALFDAHLRLQDLYSVVRKPVSAPLALQRDLASQIPVLAIKLPYLAAPTKRRNAIAAGWLSTVRSSWVTVFLFFAAALLAGGVWYAVTTNSHRGSATTATNSVMGGSMSAGASDAAMANASQNAASSNANLQNANISQPNLHGTDGSFATNNSSSVYAGIRASMRSADRQSVSANRSNGRLLNSKGTLTTERMQSNGSTTTSLENTFTTANSQSAIDASANGNPATSTDPFELPPLPMHPVAAIEQPTYYRFNHNIIIGYPESGGSSSEVPIRVYASGGSRYIMPMKAQPLSQFVTEANKGFTGNLVVPSAEAGAEYEFTPWTSAGLRMGLTSFAQYQSFTHNSSAVLYNQFSDDSVRTAPAFWCALAITETLNPQDVTRFSVSLAGGPAFTTPVTWLGMIEGDISYDLSPTLMLRGGVSFDMEQVKQSTVGTASQPNSTAGFITASTGGTLRSDAFGLNLGISFHP